MGSGDGEGPRGAQRSCHPLEEPCCCCRSPEPGSRLLPVLPGGERLGCAAQRQLRTSPARSCASPRSPCSAVNERARSPIINFPPYSSAACRMAVYFHSSDSEIISGYERCSQQRNFHPLALLNLREGCRAPRDSHGSPQLSVPAQQVGIFHPAFSRSGK